ncbi:acyltransferase [Flammeovirga pacifica]|uniref:Galactoside O-acetyltransferase n=1 Tax=Flammeovirga pacifica TaxID=915059 RepID=A0A1S1YV85_FLAPC|nr:acyltransferase [Flammeovirga pacifica]OHX64939.1 galactoside O-acetyltransferase [Flammeovirga pacifica]
MAFLTKEQLKKLGFKRFGENVLISDKASIYSPEKISIGNHVRIDDFCILSGSITLGSYIHISAYTALYGKMGIIMEDYSGLSPRCTIFSANDDFSGEFMISPMVPKEYTNVTGGVITIKRYVQVGTNSILLPNITLEEGAVVGAMSLVKNDIPHWELHGGVPTKYIKDRKKDIHEISKLL